MAIPVPLRVDTTDLAGDRTSATLTLATPPVGTTGMAVVWGWRDVTAAPGDTVTAMSWRGTALTEVPGSLRRHASNQPGIIGFYLPNPAIDAGGDLVATFSGTLNDSWVKIIWMSDVDTADMIGAVAVAAAISNALSVSLTAESDDSILIGGGTFFGGDGAADGVTLAGAGADWGQVAVGDTGTSVTTDLSYNGQVRLGGTVASTLYTMTGTWTASDGWVGTLFEIRGSTGGGSTPTTIPLDPAVLALSGSVLAVSQGTTLELTPVPVAWTSVPLSVSAATHLGLDPASVPVVGQALNIAQHDDIDLMLTNLPITGQGLDILGAVAVILDAMGMPWVGRAMTIAGSLVLWKKLTRATTRDLTRNNLGYEQND